MLFRRAAGRDPAPSRPRSRTTQANLRLQALRPHTARAPRFAEHSAECPARPPFHREHRLRLRRVL